ncbi:MULTISPECIES: DUF308 domain-containing protein [unclassified Clostridium]|uniref:HdeD family acid-resistance protein n=1 Tax=unclassified Clostridium TaxID=2614128 RepID=UPI001106C5B9|nr:MULTISPECIES: DUF308 domain-containing protein [unclassified Clostridium]
MLKSWVRQALSLGLGLAYIALGLAALVKLGESWRWTVYVIGLVLIGLAVAHLISGAQKSEKGYRNPALWAQAALTLALGVTLQLHPGDFEPVVQVVLGLWIAGQGMIDALVGLQLWLDGEPGGWTRLALALLSWVFAGTLFAVGQVAELFYSLVLGVYLLLFGLRNIYRVLEQRGVLRKPLPQSVKRRLSISLPIFIEAFYPSHLLRKIRRAIRKQGAESFTKAYEIGGESADIEVYIHLAEPFMSSFGHLDIAIGDTVISYGNYDPGGHLLWGLFSRGVVAVAPREDYIYYCIEKENKVLLGYTISATAQQFAAVREKLDELYGNWQRWKPVRGDKRLDYLFKMQKYTGARFYRVVKSPFRRFSTLSTNCVRMVDQLLGAMGFRRIAPGDTITPGACYRFFEGELAREESPVRGRRIYVKNGGKDLEKRKKDQLRREKKEKKRRRRQKKAARSKRRAAKKAGIKG